MGATMSYFFRLLIVAAALALSLGSKAADTDVGIVLLHGKWDRPPTHILALARTLESSGFRVATPTMPWSLSRGYDADYPAALEEIDAAVKSLREQGAKHIVVGGQSFGANAVIAYAGSGREVDGIMAIGPGHTPDRSIFRKQVAGSVELAQKMIAEGKGAESATFDDLNQGKTRSFRMSAKTYLSYFDPAGLASMPKSAAAIRKPAPFLLIIGTQDPLFAAGEDYIFNKVPKHPNNQYVVVQSNHLNTPAVAVPEIVKWLKALGY